MDPNNSHLLKLPVELRLRIYMYIVPDTPLFLPPSVYTGLFYSCKQVQREWEPELVKNMANFLVDMQEHMAKTDQEIRIPFLPESLHEMRNLTLWKPRGSDAFTSTFLGLTYLHFNVLTVKVFNEGSANEGHTQSSDAPDPFIDPRQNRRYKELSGLRSLARSIGEYDYWESTPYFRKLVFDWSDCPLEDNEVSIQTAHGALRRKEAWKLIVEKDEKGWITKASFQRTRKAWGTRMLDVPRW